MGLRFDPFSETDVFHVPHPSQGDCARADKRYAGAINLAQADLLARFLALQPRFQSGDKYALLRRRVHKLQSRGFLRIEKREGDAALKRGGIDDRERRVLDQRDDGGDGSPLAGPFLWAAIIVIGCIGSFFIGV